MRVECESSTPTPRPLFEGRMAGTVRRNWAQWLVTVGEGGAQEPLALGRPTYGVGRPQGGPPGTPLWPDASSTVMNFGNMVHGQKFARKDVQIIFPKGF